jgi:hypothetical protein
MAVAEGNGGGYEQELVNEKSSARSCAPKQKQGWQVGLGETWQAANRWFAGAEWGKAISATIRCEADQSDERSEFVVGGDVQR